MDSETINTLYNAIPHRRSVRSYSAAPLAAARQDEMMLQCAATNALFAAEPVAFKLLAANQVGGMLSAKSPHYLAVYANHTEQGVASAAFRLQQMDLWLSRQGIATCWLGMTKPKGAAKSENGLPFVILLAVGSPAEGEAVHRASTSEFKRKPLGEITGLTAPAEVLEALRLAPSATNRQPWFITGGDNALHLHMKESGVLEKTFLGMMPMVDVGIALCHLWLAAEHTDVFGGFAKESPAPAAPEGYRYALSLNLK